MAIFARVLDGAVAELLTTTGPTPECNAAVGEWIDITSISPDAQVGWSFTAPETFAAPAAPAGPPPALQAAIALNAGLAITSTSTSALDGTYALDSITQSKIVGISVYILKNSAFPGEASTLQWPDVSGAMHTFPSIAEFEAFASAVATYVTALDIVILTNTGTLPAASATIA